MELRKTDNYYGACLATEPPLPFGLAGGDSNNKHLFPATASLQYLKSDIVIYQQRSFYLILYDRSIERVLLLINYNIRFQIL